MSPQEIADKCVCPIDNEVRCLRAENERLKRELETAKNLRMLDRAEVIQLRRMVGVLIEEKEAAVNG